MSQKFSKPKLDPASQIVSYTLCVETNKSKNMNITEMRKPEKRMQKIILNILLHMQSSELVKVQVRKGFR